MSGRVFPILKDYQKFTAGKDGGFVTVNCSEFDGFEGLDKARINVPGISSLTIVPEGQYITHRDELKKNKTPKSKEKTETDEVFAATNRTSKKLDIESEKSLTGPNQTNLSKLSQPEVEQDFLEPLTLEVEASEGTWISISVDGNEAKDIRLSTDEIHQWEAKKEYLLTLGNTHAVRILLNGREIETNRTHQLLTDWVIDKSFLP